MIRTLSSLFQSSDYKEIGGRWIRRVGTSVTFKNTAFSLIRLIYSTAYQCPYGPNTRIRLICKCLIGLTLSFKKCIAMFFFLYFTQSIINILQRSNTSSSHGILANELDTNIVVCPNSSLAISFAFGLILFAKGMKPLIPSAMNLRLKQLVYFFGFYDISTIVGYSMPNQFLYNWTVLFKTNRFTISTHFNC